MPERLDALREVRRRAWRGECAARADPSRNERNVAFSYDSVVALGEGRTTLVGLIIPPMPDDEDCFYQLDVVTGYPLSGRYSSQ